MASGPVDHSSHHNELVGELFPVDFQPATRSWYYTKDEIDNHSPSRKDGIDRGSESLTRKSFCSFLKDLGIKLRASPVTVATAMMFCHRFYMRQSLLKNDWQTIATACMFLACKVEENLRPLRDVVMVAYEIIYKWDPSAPKKIRQRGITWWMHFDVSPKQLQEVTQQMLRYFKQDGKQKITQAQTNETKPTQKVENITSQKTPSCAQSEVTLGSELKRKGSPTHTQNHTTKTRQALVDDAAKIEVGHLREAIKKAKQIKYAKNKIVALTEDEGNGDIEIERELEKGVELAYHAAPKKQKVI